jgi:uncharacterized membrane protein
MTRPTNPAPRRPDWLIPALLILLSLVPSIAGVVRLAQLAAGPPVTAANARFFAQPVPVVLHIIAVVPFSLLGALQFSRTLRTRGARWHRWSGRIVAPAGLVASLTGLWMATYYAWPAGDGFGVYVERLVFGTAMTVALVLALVAVYRRDFSSHGDWMTRAYAIGLGAGTQVFTHLPWLLLIGTPDETGRTITLGAGWLINVLVAEWTIRRRPSARIADLIPAAR